MGKDSRRERKLKHRESERAQTLLKMFLVLACLALASFVTCNPIIFNKEVQKPLDPNYYQYALDVSTSVTNSQYKCLKQNSYGVVFIRGYGPENGGHFDSNVISNYKNAQSAGLSAEVYMTPLKTSSFMDGSKQVDELYNGLTKAGINVKRIWIQVATGLSSNWADSASSNWNFISNAQNRIRQLGLKTGIYTSSDEWNKLTNNNKSLGNTVGLWYFNVNGSGSSGETSQDFSDFSAFGSWIGADAKQFGQNEQICGVNANRDIASVYSF